MESADCIPKSLRPLATPVIILPKKLYPSHPKNQQLHLVLDYCLLNKSINAAYSGKRVIFILSLAKLHRLISEIVEVYIFSSKDLRSGYHHIGLTPEAKQKIAFATISRKWHWNAAPFGICSLPGEFCYLMSQVLSGLDICFTNLISN